MSSCRIFCRTCCHHTKIDVSQFLTVIFTLSSGTWCGLCCAKMHGEGRGPDRCRCLTLDESYIPYGCLRKRLNGEGCPWCGKKDQALPARCTGPMEMLRVKNIPVTIAMPASIAAKTAVGYAGSKNMQQKKMVVTAVRTHQRLRRV